MGLLPNGWFTRENNRDIPTDIDQFGGTPIRKPRYTCVFRAVFWTHGLRLASATQTADFEALVARSPSWDEGLIDDDWLIKCCNHINPC